MKKFTYIILTLIVVLISYWFIDNKDRPYEAGKVLSDFNVDELMIDEFTDEWGITGDGETFIIFSFPDSKKSFFIEESQTNDYKELPITESLPDDFIYTHYDMRDSVGYYKLEVESDQMSYKLVILNLQKNKLFIYNAVF